MAPLLGTPIMTIATTTILANTMTGSITLSSCMHV